MLLSAQVKRFSLSCMQDFSTMNRRFKVKFKYGLKFSTIYVFHYLFSCKKKNNIPLFTHFNLVIREKRRQKFIERSKRIVQCCPQTLSGCCQIKADLLMCKVSICRNQVVKNVFNLFSIFRNQTGGEGILVGMVMDLFCQ